MIQLSRQPIPRQRFNAVLQSKCCLFQQSLALTLVADCVPSLHFGIGGWIFGSVLNPSLSRYQQHIFIPSWGAPGGTWQVDKQSRKAKSSLSQIQQTESSQNTQQHPCSLGPERPLSKQLYLKSAWQDSHSKTAPDIPAMVVKKEET